MLVRFPGSGAGGADLGRVRIDPQSPPMRGSRAGKYRHRKPRKICFKSTINNFFI